METLKEILALGDLILYLDSPRMKIGILPEESYT